MNFDFTTEQEMLRDMVSKLLAREAPESYVRQLDELSEYPYKLHEAFARVGLLGLPFPVHYGGQAGTLLDFLIVSEALGRIGYDVATVYGVPVFCGLTVLEHGTEAQREALLRPLIAGELRLAVSMSEADAGSDVGAMRTLAVRDGDDYIINGEKTWCSGGDIDKTVLLVYVRTDPTAHHSKALSAFLIDNKSAGLDIRRIRTVGRHLLPTTQITLTDVHVPAASRLGDEGNGWKILLSGLLRERLLTSAAYVGNAATVVDEALAYAKNRVQFGKRIGDFQVIAHMLADMYTEVEASRLLTYKAAAILDGGSDAVLAVAMAKLFGSERFAAIADQGMQILGGQGYAMEGSMQRHWRAARGSTITAGTSQMQRQTIARQLGLRPQ